MTTVPKVNKNVKSKWSWPCGCCGMDPFVQTMKRPVVNKGIRVIGGFHKEPVENNNGEHIAHVSTPNGPLTVMIKLAEHFNVGG